MQQNETKKQQNEDGGKGKAASRLAPRRTQTSNFKRQFSGPCGRQGKRAAVTGSQVDKGLSNTNAWIVVKQTSTVVDQRLTTEAEPAEAALYRCVDCASVLGPSSPSQLVLHGTAVCGRPGWSLPRPPLAIVPLSVRSPVSAMRWLLPVCRTLPQAATRCCTLLYTLLHGPPHSHCLSRYKHLNLVVHCARHRLPGSAAADSIITHTLGSTSNHGCCPFRVLGVMADTENIIPPNTI